MQGGKKYSPKSITFTSFFCGSGDRRPSSALRQSPAFAFLGGPLKLFFALRCLLFSQTKLIPVNYYHPGMNGFGTETWGRVSKMAFWDAHQVITATRSVCVCALTSGRGQSEILWFLVTLPASSCTWCALGTVLSGDDTVSTHWVVLGQAAASLGTSPCGFSSVALIMEEKDWVVLRISRDNCWIFIKHIR